jgi:hypothetical protein
MSASCSPRRLALFCLVATLAGAFASAGPACASGRSSAQASFARFAAAQPGHVAVAVAPLSQGPMTAYGTPQAAEAWST